MTNILFLCLLSSYTKGQKQTCVCVCVYLPVFTFTKGFNLQAKGFSISSSSIQIKVSIKVMKQLSQSSVDGGGEKGSWHFNLGISKSL